MACLALTGKAAMRAKMASAWAWDTEAGLGERTGGVPFVATRTYVWFAVALFRHA